MRCTVVSSSVMYCRVRYCGDVFDSIWCAVVCVSVVWCSDW